MNKITIKPIIAGLVLAAFCLATRAVWAQSLYEYYSNTSRSNLEQETREMGDKLRSTFDQTSISARQRDIDFAEYYASLKKLLFYGAKLANYADYEQDLSFARDKEIFKGLPKKTVRQDDKSIVRKDFVSDKYEKMKGNVKEEIATYKDMLQLSLDCCQSIISNDFYNMTENSGYRDRMHELMLSQTYRDYLKKREQLAGRWEELAKDIRAQLNLWREQPVSPDAPIIRPEIVEAI